MSGFEIVLLVMGVGAFAASFLIPDKKSGPDRHTMQLGEEKVKELVDKELSQVRSKIEDVIDETITYSVEKSERILERLSNEKIGAVNEYSDTVLKNIHKNHEEVMFLYDMLNQKQKALKTSALEAEKAVKVVEEKAKEVKQEMTQEGPWETVEPPSEKTPDSHEEKQEQNSNQKILQLRKEGKSKTAIAKELGLGVGEVKLVIDLFEGSL